MNYCHSYHAGNFADVLKHVTLVMLMDSFLRKPKPFCYLDTHAGSGYYDLSGTLAAKTKEYEDGIQKVIRADNPPAAIKRYLDCIQQIDNKLSQSPFASLRYYPGSPLIARTLARPHDSLIACEWQEDAYQALKKTFVQDKQVAIHHMDGYLGLKAFLPPRERRGLILIDPPYEKSEEFSRIVQTLSIALKRFPTGTFVVWYPIKEKELVERFHRTLRQAIRSEIFAIELNIYPEIAQRLTGSGLVIINPPWQIERAIQAILPWLWKTLAVNGQGNYRTFPLK